MHGINKRWIIGNWKMNGSATSINSFVSELSTLEARVAEVGICPPFPYLQQFNQNLVSTSIRLGAQNVYAAQGGAYTGEVSPIMLKDFGCSLCIIGHSERRQIFGEQGELITDKLRLVIDEELIPILCVGETLEQRDAKQHHNVVAEQLSSILPLKKDCSQLIVAYEPVWAIGTGRSASVDDILDMHRFIRNWLQEQQVAEAMSIPILYGGSVNADNAKEYASQPEICGALVGGASLKCASFSVIVNAFDA